MTNVPTFTAAIYVGEPVPGAAARVCRAYCDEIGLCVTVTPTLYVYEDGQEYGVAVGLINYPRFPSAPEAIREKALALAKLLLDNLCQRGVSIVFPEETVWISSAEAPQAPSIPKFGSPGCAGVDCGKDGGGRNGT